MNYLEICQGRYPSEVIFREHMKRVHAKVTCDMCENNFTRTELKKHRSKVHGGLIVELLTCDIKFA